MAKKECILNGNFDVIIKDIEATISNFSTSVSLEDSSDYTNDQLKCSIRVFERYSMIGGNRVSLSITLLRINENQSFFSAITAGGSQAVIFKINTFGEEAFLDSIDPIINRYG